MAQAVGYQSVTVEAQAQTQGSPGEIYRGQIGTGTGFPLSTSFFSYYHYHSISASYSFIPQLLVLYNCNN
jgi:hypothetical protein